MSLFNENDRKIWPKGLFVVDQSVLGQAPSAQCSYGGHTSMDKAPEVCQQVFDLPSPLYSVTERVTRTYVI